MAFVMAPMAYPAACHYIIHTAAAAPQMPSAAPMLQPMPQPFPRFLAPMVHATSAPAPTLPPAPVPAPAGLMPLVAPGSSTAASQPPPPPALPPVLNGMQPAATQPPPQHRAQTAKCTAAPSEITAAVDSLYEDELKPYGRILRKRFAEHAQATGRGDVDISIKELRAACEACLWLDVQDVEGADWAALLPGREGNFIDVYSPVDVYPSELWEQATAYFGSLNEEDMVLPGGRYSCAQVLVQRELPFLAGRSLGQICHVVQLAISQKKILGYLNGTVVPYNRSGSMVKEKNAECQLPCASTTRGKTAIADWDDVRTCLQTLIDNLGPSEQSLPLSNIKRLFRTQFQVELSETALGYAKLSELLQDERLRHMCDVRLRGHGYVILPLTADGSARAKEEEEDAACEAAAPPRTGESPSAAPSRFAVVQPQVGGAVPAPARAAAAAAIATPMRSPFPPTPSPGSAAAAAAAAAASYGRSLPRLLGSIRAGPQALFGEPMKPCPAGAVCRETLKVVTSPTAVQVQVQAVAPLRVQALTPIRAIVARSPQSGDVIKRRPDLLVWRAAPLTPSTLGALGFGVRNTFIHAAGSPPTPLQPGARARSLSPAVDA